MIRGKVWKFGDCIDTDVIIPGRYLDNYSPGFLAAHVMEGIDPEFSSKISPGDIIVAGRSFGIGSSREQAAIALKAAGIGAIVAESFARIFYRNAINQGLLAVVCPGCSEYFVQGEMICIDTDACRVVGSREGGSSLEFRPFSPTVLEIIEAGGLISLLRREMGQKDDTDTDRSEL